jgi:hypothetical protein
MVRGLLSPKIVSQKYNERGEFIVDVQRSKYHRFAIDHYEPTVESMISRFEEELDVKYSGRQKNPKKGVTDRLVFI